MQPAFRASPGRTTTFLFGTKTYSHLENHFPSKKLFPSKIRALQAFNIDIGAYEKSADLSLKNMERSVNRKSEKDCGGLQESIC